MADPRHFEGLRHSVAACVENLGAIGSYLGRYGSVRYRNGPRASHRRPRRRSFNGAPPHSTRSDAAVAVPTRASTALRTSLHGTSHGPNHTAQPRQPCARCSSRLCTHACRAARHFPGGCHVTSSTPNVRWRARYKYQISDGPSLLSPLPARACRLWRFCLSLQCSLLSLRPASRTARRLLSVSRVAFASARAQPPSHADDRPVGPPSGPNACRAVAERQSRGRRARPDRSDSPACSRSSRAA